MEPHAILLKSPRGHDEIRTRAHRLPVLARRLLIMADGRRTVADLAAELDCAPDDGKWQQALRQLLDGRYVLVRDDRDAINENKWPSPNLGAPPATA